MWECVVCFQPADLICLATSRALCSLHYLELAKDAEVLPVAPITLPLTDVEYSLFRKIYDALPYKPERLEAVLSSVLSSQTLTYTPDDPFSELILKAKQTSRVLTFSLLTNILASVFPELRLGPLSCIQPNKPVMSMSAHIEGVTLKILTSGNITIELQNYKFTNASRCLAIDRSTILLTGGSGTKLQNSFLIYIEGRRIKRTGDLMEGRSHHAMTWLENKPVVIAGESSTGRKLQSVESFSADSWKSINHVNFPRSFLSACCMGTKTYVFGGCIGAKCSALVERYLDGVWTILTASLPLTCIWPGTIPSDEKILILGGYDRQFRREVLQWSEHKCEVVAHLDTDSTFAQNAWIKRGTQFVAFDDFGNIVRFSLAGGRASL